MIWKGDWEDICMPRKGSNVSQEMWPFHTAGGMVRGNTVFIG